MRYDEEQLNAVYDKTSGYCHVCGKKLALTNYGKRGRRGAWQVEHSKPRARGGTDHLNNLYPACIDCNQNKGVRTTRTARSWHGRARAPLSVQRREEAKRGNAAVGVAVGGLLGSVAGPWGALVGALIGGRLGYKYNPQK